MMGRRSELDGAWIYSISEGVCDMEFDNYSKFLSDVMRSISCNTRSRSRVIMPSQRIYGIDLVRAHNCHTIDNRVMYIEM